MCAATPTHALQFHSPLFSFSPAGLPQSNDSILSQKVYGELVLLMSLVKNRVKKCLPLSADHPDYLVFFRIYVSRRAASKGRAVLEGVGLDAPTIDTCFEDHSKTVEEAIQTGLIKWSDGQSCKPPTWEVLLWAMAYAEIAQQDIAGLKTALGLH